MIAADDTARGTLGGEVSDNEDATFASWEPAPRVPRAIGLAVGRSLPYPPGDNAVAAAASLLPREGTA